MGITNPQNECPATNCRHCDGEIGGNINSFTNYQMIGFCTIVCEALWLRRQLIATGKYNIETGELV